MIRSSRFSHILLFLSLLFVDISAQSAKDVLRRLGDRPTSIELSGPVSPWLTLAPGRALPGSPESTEGIALPLREGAESLALRTGDVNEDGVPDLIHLLAVGASAMVETRLGRAATIFPFSLRVARETGAHDEEGLPFAQPQTRIRLSVRPAFFVVADVTLDGHLDLIFASAGSETIFRRDGDGEGGFAPPSGHQLPGRITLLETGDMDLADGLMDLLIGVETPQQSLLLLEYGSHHDFLQQPEMIELPDSGSAAVVGRLDGDHLADLVVAFGESWGLVRGTSASRGKGETRLLGLVRTGDTEIAALAIGNFVGGSGNDLLLLNEAGRLDAFERLGDEFVSTSSRSLALHSGSHEARSGNWRMQRARVSSFEHDDLVLSGNGTAGIEIFAQLGADSGERRLPEPGTAPVRVSLLARSTVVDVVAMHLNRDGRQDLVVLEERGPEALSIVQTQQASGYTVNATSTEPDGNPGDGKCAIEPCQDGNCTGPCTLPAALLEAALHLGEDSITFDLPAGSTIEGVNVGGTQPIVVDGNIDGSPGVILDGGVPGAEGFDGVFLDASDSLITGLVIHRWAQSFSAGGRGVHILGGTGNRIIGNYIGTDLTGNVPVDQAEIFKKAEAIQVLGDGTFISGNVIGGHQGGIVLNSDANEVTENNVGVGKDARTMLFSSAGGIRLMGDNNRIGKNTSDGNLVSGNRENGGFSGGVGIGVAGKGNRIQGNVIGLAADQTLLPNGFAILDEGTETLIGGPIGSQRNLIAEAVLLTGTGTKAMGNRLGTNAAGDQSLGANAGFDITGSGHRIGGEFSEEGNIIAGGGSHGIRVSGAFDVEVRNNSIGTGRNGFPALGKALDAILVDSSQKIVVRENILANSSSPGASGVAILGQSQVELRENAIFDNAGLGIDWGADGITENDTSEDVPNHPILESFEAGLLTGRLDAGSGKFRVEVFRSSACDDSAVDSEGRPHGEGRDHVQTFSDLQSGPIALSVSAFVTGSIAATATDENGSTSEFSNCIVASSAPIFLVNSTTDRREPMEKRGDSFCDTGEETERGLAECTLRAALEEANIDPDRNAIRFSDGLGTIEVEGAPLLIVHPLDVRAPEGTFQRVFAVGSVGWGLRVDGEGTVIEGLEIRHFQTGIQILGQAELRGNRLLENLIGIQTRLGNSTAPILIGGPSNATNCESPCNLISENSERGLDLGERPTVVQGNWIGLTEDGGRAPGQPVGIHSSGAANPEDVLIGGSGEGQENFISADPEKGACIEIEGSNLVIQGNRIGVDASGNRSLGCGPHAITFKMIERPVQNNLIGGLNPGEGNRIAMGTLDGIRFLDRSTPDSTLVRQLFLSNTFIGSGRLGVAINLNGNGSVTDFLDKDKGNNGLQNHPRVTQVLQKPNNQFGPAATFIFWKFFEALDDDVTLQFFSQPDLEAPGETLLSSVQFETATSAEVGGAEDQRARTTRQQVTILDFALSSDERVTATATSALSGTSEFSPLPRSPSLDTDWDGVADFQEPGKEQDPRRTDLNLRRLVMELDSTTRARVTLLLELLELDGRIFPGDLVGMNLGGQEGPGAVPAGSDEIFTVTLTLPDGFEADSYYNFGPEAGDPTDHYYEFLFDGETGAEIDGNTITLHYVDGSRGDHDLTINGQIETLGGWVVFTEPLYFPFLRSTSSAFTGLAVSNYNDDAVRLKFNGFDPEGIPTGGLLNPSPFVLEGGEQLAMLGSEVFQLSPTEEVIGWVKVEVDRIDVGSFSQVGQGASLDGSVAWWETAEELVFTRVFQGQGAYRGLDALTTLSVVNPNSTEVEVELELVAGTGPAARTGSQLGPVTRTIAPRGQLLKTVEELFATIGTTSGGLVRVNAVRAGATACDGLTTRAVCGLIGFELIEIPLPGSLIGLNAVVPSAATELYSAQLASVHPAIFTNIKLANLGDQTVQATLRAVSAAGGDLADAVEVTLGPGELREQDARDLFGFAAAAVGSLRVQADGPGLVGDVVFGDPTNSTFAAALPLQSELLVDAVFSQVANVTGFFTGLALYVPGASQATVTIDVFRADGTLGGTTEVILAGGERLSKSVVELLEETEGQAGGYIRIRSTQPLVAQQLFGDNGLNLLSAVPPRVIP